MRWKFLSLSLPFKLAIILLLKLSMVHPLLPAQQAITVHFLYGSKPAKGFQETESRWFGGRRGGHVGLEFEKDHVLNFMPQGKFHWVAHRHQRHSHFADLTVSQTYECLGGSDGALKMATIRIPLDSTQYSQLVELVHEYLAEPPYDYAFLGMRCAAATDELLAKIGITKSRSHWGSIFHTFRPKALRKRLFHKALVYGWKVEKWTGSERRIWEKDAALRN